jgi:hypothetical protein
VRVSRPHSWNVSHDRFALNEQHAAQEAHIALPALPLLLLIRFLLCYGRIPRTSKELDKVLQEHKTLPRVNTLDSYAGCRCEAARQACKMALSELAWDASLTFRIVS